MNHKRRRHKAGWGKLRREAGAADELRAAQAAMAS